MFGPFGPQDTARLMRIVQIGTCILLGVAALGLWNNFFVLRLGIMFGFVMVGILAVALRYSQQGIVAFAAALIFCPVLDLNIPRHIWVIIDMVSFAGLTYFTVWATNSFQKGTRFERYVSTLFPESEYAMVDRTRDTSKFLDRHVESDAHPDFVFRNRQTGNEFAIECKWRARWTRGKSGDLGIWWSHELSDKYMHFARERAMPVFIAFGIGGTPSQPSEVYFIEVERLHYAFLLQTLIRSGHSSLN